jgi:anaerobic dimethyl sulfoxide reductase subunit A
MPGVIDLGEGAWVDWDDATQIDKAGATNTLEGTTPSGQGVQPWNTNNAQVEKWTGDPLKPDYTLPMRVPIKEA